MKTPQTIKITRVHFTIENIATHLERTFQLWTIPKPSTRIQVKRSAIFITSLLITIFWPFPNLLANGLLLTLIWIMLSLTNKPVNRLFLLTNLMLSVSFLFYLTQLWVGPGPRF